jgi:hypothetical protein
VNIYPDILTESQEKPKCYEYATDGGEGKSNSYSATRGSNDGEHDWWMISLCEWNKRGVAAKFQVGED